MKQVKNEDTVSVVLSDHGLNGHCGSTGARGESWRSPISILWSLRSSVVPCDLGAAGTPGLVLQHL